MTLTMIHWKCINIIRLMTSLLKCLIMTICHLCWNQLESSIAVIPWLTIFLLKANLYYLIKVIPYWLVCQIIIHVCWVIFCQGIRLKGIKYVWKSINWMRKQFLEYSNFFCFMTGPLSITCPRVMDISIL